MHAERRSRKPLPDRPKWTPALVLERVEEAVSVIQRLPGPQRPEYRACWPETLSEPDEAAEAEPASRRLLPTPEQIARADEVLVWLAALPEKDATVLWWRAAGRDWREVAARAGLPPGTARWRLRVCLYRLSMDLNAAGAPVHGRPRRKR